MTRLVLLRHGQTDWNLQRRFQGHLDVPMNDTGRAQARAAAPVVAAEGPGAIVSSHLSRALDTAREVAAVTGLPVATDERLAEIHVGSWGGLTTDEMAARDPEAAAALRSGADFRRSPTGETAEEVGRRVRLALLDAAARHEGGTTLVVSHGLALRTATAALLGWPAPAASQLETMGNCCWAVVDHHPGRGWRLAAWNRVAR